MSHQLTAEDKLFKQLVESCEFPVDNFDHRAHLRLAYCYLVDHPAKDAVAIMRGTLISLLKHAGIDPAQKYHETLTEAWILAVSHFMNNSDAAGSADAFIDHHPALLDSKIMLSHYSAERLYSDQARQAFLPPDLEPIPTLGQ